MSAGLSHAETFGRVPTDFGTPLRIRTVDCCCGGVIVANVEDPGDTVLRHNRSGHHRAWEMRVGLPWLEERRETEE